MIALNESGYRRRMASIVSWSKVILFGDSITQHSFDPDGGCWGALLANKLQRVADVVCRGFSGYNTRWCDIILNKVITSALVQDASCIVIFLGANDSFDPNEELDQHIPVDEYESNLCKMVDYLISLNVKESTIILVTPAPYQQDRFAQQCQENGRVPSFKTNTTIVEYVNACKRVAKKQGTLILDLFAGFSKKGDLDKLLVDGLHFTKHGGQLTFNLLWPLVEKCILDYRKSLDLNYPVWTDLATKKITLSEL